MTMTEIKTLHDAVKYFAYLDACFEYMLGIKWPAGDARQFLEDA